MFKKTSNIFGFTEWRVKCQRLTTKSRVVPKHTNSCLDGKVKGKKIAEQNSKTKTNYGGHDHGPTFLMHSWNWSWSDGGIKTHQKSFLKRQSEMQKISVQMISHTMWLNEIRVLWDCFGSYFKDLARIYPYVLLMSYPNLTILAFT